MKVFSLKLILFFKILIAGCMLFDYGISKISESQMTYLQEQLEINRLDEVIVKGEEFKINNTENLKLRKILFKAYLYKKLFKKAESEVAFIESRVRNFETIYLRALQAYQTNSQESALELLQQIKEKRFSDPYLLYFEIYLNKKQWQLANRYLEFYQSLEGQNNQWYFNYGRLLLSQLSINSSDVQIRQHILDYARSYPVNHQQMYLKSQYYASRDQFDYALRYIDRAIYLSFSKDDYVDQKIYFLYRNQQFRKLLDFIDQNKFTNPEAYIRYLYLKSFVYLINFKKENQTFTLTHPDYLQRTIAPLKEILSINIENGIARFFLEEILLANTDVKDQIRKPYAEYHYQKAKAYVSKGQLKNAQIHLIRMNLLFPYAQNYRKIYLESLRLNKHYENFYIEAMNQVTLYGSNDVDLTMQKQLVNKILDTQLIRQYQINEAISIPQTQVLLVYQQRSLSESWTNPYLEVIVNEMLVKNLKTSPLMNIDSVSQHALVQTIEEKDYHYQLHFKADDANGIFNFHLELFDDSRISVYTNHLVFYGKDRFFKMIGSVTTLIPNILPKVGKITAIKERKAIVSLGKLHGVKENDIFSIYKNKKLLGSFPVERIDNYYSLITIDKIFVLSKTEIGDIVIQKNKP